MLTATVKTNMTKLKLK